MWTYSMSVCKGLEINRKHFERAVIFYLILIVFTVMEVVTIKVLRKFDGATLELYNKYGKNLSKNEICFPLDCSTGTYILPT